MKKLNILLINTRHYYGGGDSTYTFNLADLLKKRGHQVAFFAMKDERNIPDPNSDLFLSHIDFNYLNQNKSILSGIKVIKRVIYSRESQNNFIQLSTRFLPDIVHLQNIHSHITPSIVFQAQKMRIPIVWTLHDYKLICPNSHLSIDKTDKICEACRGKKFYRALILRCKKGSITATGLSIIEAYCHSLLNVCGRINAFFAPSKFLYNKFLDNGFPKAKLHHLPLFIPNRDEDIMPFDKGYYLFFGSVNKIKGIEVLLNSIKSLSDVKLLIAGKLDNPKIQNVIESLSGRVQYVGFKTGRDLNSLIAGARAVIVPSLSYENQPFSILEAFSYGKPVVASDLGGMSELIKDKDGDRGLLFPAGNEKELANCITWMSENSNHLYQMGENAKRYIINNHCEEIHYEKLLKVYSQLVRK